jgi:hypothetical protein
MFLAADHDNRAVRVMHTVLADRAEQRFGESAVSAAAHHQEIGSVGGIEQHLRGISSTTRARNPTLLQGSTTLLIASPRVFCGILAGAAAYKEKLRTLPVSGATFLILLHFPVFSNLRVGTVIQVGPRYFSWTALDDRS